MSNAPLNVVVNRKRGKANNICIYIYKKYVCIWDMMRHYNGIFWDNDYHAMLEGMKSLIWG